MNTSADAADQVVRMSLNGAEVALKVSGKGAAEISKLLYRALKNASNESNKTKGAMRLKNLVRSGKRLDVCKIKDVDLKRFCLEAKKYGILYTVLKDRDATDGMTEIMYKSEDESKVQMIYQKLDMAPFDMAQVKEETVNELSQKKVPERAQNAPEDIDQFIDKIMEKANPTKDEGQTKNPTEARTARKTQSEPSSKAKSKATRESSEGEHMRDGRRSVRQELSEIKAEQEKRIQKNRPKSKNTPTKINEHKVPPKKKKAKER